MALTPGTRLGPYEVLAPLGAGGMGEVYRARDTRLDRTVAIKVLPAHLTDTPELKSRFEREARAVSSLNHPNICTLYDIGTENGVDYLVMEHIEGETLAARLERGPLSTPEVLRYGAEIADALDKAHRQGMVHRDLKPGNVMLTKSGAKLLDFGLARIIGVENGNVAGTVSGVSILSQKMTIATPLTGAGMLVGTFQYMAPEQLEGGEADARSDIWAFGATLYEMATGLKAFTGNSQASLIASILKEQPRPISEIQPLTPPGLDRIVRRCLEKDPDDRWQSARDLAHELEWIGQAGSQAGVAAPIALRRRTTARLLTIGFAVSTLAAVALAAALLMRKEPEQQVVRFEIRQPSTIQFEDAPRISPDGRFLAYTGTDSAGVIRVWIRAMSGTTAEPMAGTDGITFRPFWSPDSRYLGFFAQGKLKKIPVGGGPPITICDAPTGADGSWGKAGVILFDGAATDPIRRVSASGGIASTAIPADTVKGETPGWPYFLPDGKHFLYQNITNATLCVGTLGSPKGKEIGKSDSRAEYTAPGYVLFLRGSTLLAQKFDAGAQKFSGEPFPVAEQVRTAPNGGGDFSVSTNGTLVYASGGTQVGRFVWVDRTGKELGEVPTGIVSLVLNPDLSMDGKWLAFRSQDPQTQTRDIWTTDLVRGVSSRFTFEPRNENQPLWSPDGSQIAYYSNATNAAGVYLKPSRGAGQAKLLLASEDDAILCDWSDDGRTIFFDRGTNNGKQEIWTLPLDGSGKAEQFMAGTFNYSQPRLSPDGRFLVYTSDESGRDEIYVQTYPEHDGKWQISTGGGKDAHWRSDGKELVYFGADLHIMSVPVQTSPTFQAGTATPLFLARVMFPGLPLRTHYNMSGDGSRFLLAAPRGAETVAPANVILNWAAEAGRR